MSAGFRQPNRGNLIKKIKMRKFLREELRWASLKFKNSQLENEYQLEKEIFQRWTFTLFFTLLFVITFLLWLTGFGTTNSFTIIRVSTNIIRLLSPIFVFLIVRLHPRWIEGTIIVVMTLSLVFYVEVNRQEFLTLSPADIFLIGGMIQTICIFLILVNISFGRLFLFFFIINIYVSYRLFNGEDFNWIFLRSLMIGIGNFIFLSAFAYGKEFYHRKIHYEMKTYENSLVLYERLIKEIIPLSIIIYDDNETYFINKETSKIMNVAEGEDIKKKLNEFHVSEVRSFDADLDEGYHSSNYSETSLTRNFCHLMKKVQPQNELYSCTITPHFPANSEADEEPINIKFKVGKIIWKIDKKAKIIFISEDFRAKELKILKQKESFKDKFLATISHEFRTPLNGIIGMISVAMENCQEKSINGRLSK